MSPKQRSTEKDRVYDRTQGLIEDFTFNAFKRRKGYSSLEIARKREALENVLIPYRMTENEEMLHHAGFRAVDAFFKWYNFAGLIALK